METQLLIIGAGTAGVRTAVTAAHNGVKTVLVGAGPLAGTCLNNGCIPTKSLLHAADVLREVQRSDEIGIHVTAKPKFADVLKRVNGIVEEGVSHARKTVKNTDNLTYIEGFAKFVAKKTVEVDRKRITAEKIIVATGTAPFIPPIEGIQDVEYYTNENILSLTKQPSSMILIGGGYIACEFATFFATMGVRVTIVERGPTLLGVLDEDIRDPIVASLQDMGVRIITNAAVTSVSQTKNRTTCTIAGADVSRVAADMLFVAAGRFPNTKGLGVDHAGIKLSKRGFIDTDSYLRSSNKDVYAIGDVNGEALFAHAAKRESWFALEHALYDTKFRYRPELVPWAVFTHPVAAGVGKSEFQLRQEGTTYSVMEAACRSNGKARIIQEPEGKIKVLHHEGRILGAFMVGAQADNIIHEFVALIHSPNGMRTLKEMIHIHPTLSEVVEQLRPRK